MVRATKELMALREATVLLVDVGFHLNEVIQKGSLKMEYEFNQMRKNHISEEYRVET